MLYLRLDFRHKLDRRGAGADYRYPFAAQVVVMVPAGGMKQLALKILQAGNVGNDWFVQVAGAGHDSAGQVEPIAGLHFPEVFAFPPLGSFHRLIEADVIGNGVALGGVAHIVEDFRLPGEGPAPVRFLGEGIGIQRRGHIAGAARVGVVPPGAAQICGLFQDHKVTEAGFPEANAQANAADAGAHDQDVINRSIGLLCHGLSGVTGWVAG